MRNKPRIRFKGFTEDWEQCKLGDLLILLKDGSHGTHKNTSEGVYLLSAKNIKNGRINIMPDDRIISWDDYNVIHKNYELQSGDILLTIVGSIGETAIYNLKTKVTFQRSVAFLRPNLKLKNGFLYTLMNTDRFQNQLQTKQVVSAQPGIYLGDLASINITYPKNVSEQEKIYNIFKGIEHSITLHQRKLEKLKLAKKALLQKLFPKNGSQFPEIRFKGFTDAWEQRKLSDISTKVTTKNVDVHYTETLTNSAEQGIISQVDFFDKEISNKDNINGYYIVDNNDFIYNPRISTLAPVGPINRNKLNRTGIMSPLYTVFRSSNVDLGFLEWYFQSSHWHRYMKLNGDSGARADRIAIKDSTFFEMTIKIPVNIKEQVLIGETLEKFNQYITLHQRKLDKLQEVKKGLLQKMFV